MIAATNKKGLENQRKLGGTWKYVDKPKVKTIREYAGKTIVDIGCSQGSYVNLLCELGYDAKGCDLLSYDEWRSKPKSRYRVCDVYNLPYRDKSLDTAILFEVFEHLEHPKEALKEVSRVVEKNIIITVPNCTMPSIFYSSGLIYYHYFDRTHINFFTPDSIQSFLTENGFKIDFIKCINPLMPVTLLLNNIYIPLKIAVIIGKIFQRVPFIRKNYADIVVVASKQK